MLIISENTQHVNSYVVNILLDLNKKDLLNKTFLFIFLFKQKLKYKYLSQM